MNALDEVDWPTRGRHLCARSRRPSRDGGRRSPRAASPRRGSCARSAPTSWAPTPKPVAALGREVAALRRDRRAPRHRARGSDGGVRRRRAGGGEPRRAARRAAARGAARARHVPIIGELELGWRATEARRRRDHRNQRQDHDDGADRALLARSRRPVLVAGNIGTPLAAHALTFPADGLVVCGGVQLPAGDHRRLPAARGGGAERHARPPRSARDLRRRTGRPRRGSSRTRRRPTARS